MGQFQFNEEMGKVIFVHHNEVYNRLSHEVVT